MYKILKNIKMIILVEIIKYMRVISPKFVNVN